MTNEALQAILRLQEENTLYERAFKEAIGIISGLTSNVPIFGIEDVDYLLKELSKVSPKKDSKDADSQSK